MEHTLLNILIVALYVAGTAVFAVALTFNLQTFFPQQNPGADTGARKLLASILGVLILIFARLLQFSAL
jgi:hypothetical protein